MSRTEQYSVTAVAEALRLSAGIYTAAAAKVGRAPNTIKGYVERHPELQELLQEVRESMLDHAESQLLKQIGDGNLTAVIFFLKCKGKQRGYVERQEMTGPSGGPIETHSLDSIDAAMKASRANSCPPPAETDDSRS